MTNLAVISPYLHLPGHYQSVTKDFSQALQDKGINHTVFSASGQTEGNASAPCLSCFPWTNIAFLRWYRSRNWGGLVDTVLRNLEFYACLHTAKNNVHTNSLMYCLDGRFRQLAHAVLTTQHRYVLYNLGRANPKMPPEQQSGLIEAFKTGRLDFIVETDSVKDSWRAIAGNHVHTIPYAIKPDWQDENAKRAARDALAIPQDAYVCLFFGTHRKGKDYITAIDAVSTMQEPPYLLFAGEVLDGEQPSRLLAERRIEHGQSIEKYIDELWVRKVFAASDIVALPYAKGYDKGSGVLLQACQFGRPVIASRTGYLERFVEEYGTGTLYEPANVADFTSGLRKMRHLSEEEKLDLEKKLKYVNHVHSWEVLIEKYIRIFQIDPLNQ